MKRYRSKGNNSFARFGLKGHTIYRGNVYRGGVRR